MSPTGCNCGRKIGPEPTGANSRLVYTLTEPNGHRRSYATETEAKSAQKRLGGTVQTSR